MKFSKIERSYQKPGGLFTGSFIQDDNTGKPRTAWGNKSVDFTSGKNKYVRAP